MAVVGAARHGKSSTGVTRGCFLLGALMLLMMMLAVKDAASLSPRRHLPPRADNLSAKFRRRRSAFMHPTATSMSPPNKNPGKRKQSSMQLEVGTSSSSFLPPGVVSRAPASRSQMSHPAGFASMTPSHSPRTHTYMSGGGMRSSQPTVMGFNQDEASPSLRPAQSPHISHTFNEGSRGWTDMMLPKYTPNQPHLANPSSRHDTFGRPLTENLSHLHDRSSSRWETETGVRPYPGGGRVIEENPETSRTVFNGGPRQTHLWTIIEEPGDRREANDESDKSLHDFNSTSEYQTDDYSAYHEYDQIKPTWGTHDQTHSHVHNRSSSITLEQVMEIQNLTSQADLRELLEQREITLKQLQDFLNTGAQKRDILKFLAPPTPSLTTITSTSLPALPNPPSVFAISTIEDGYQLDVTRQAALPDSKTEGDDTVAEDSKERPKKHRKKDRRLPGGKRRKNRRRGKKKPRGGTSDISEPHNSKTNNATQAPAAPDPWVPSTPDTPSVFPQTTTTTTTHEGTHLPTAQPSIPYTLRTSTSPVSSPDAAIVSVTLVETSLNRNPDTPPHMTFIESATPPKRQNSHTNIWEKEKPLQIPNFNTPSTETEKTINEIEKINFVRQKQHDDYIFPLRGLLIISGLMGALVVFTLVVLISYAVIKCSKTPMVNNYQVSQQQKPAGT